MSKPFIHARSCAKKYGGDPSDYISIHNMMDSSKSAFSDNRHRAALHSSFGTYLMEHMFGTNFDSLKALADKKGWSEEDIEDIVKWKNQCIFDGTTIKNSDGKEVSVREVAELHCLEDYKMRFIPTLSDWLGEIDFKPWMNNGATGSPPSHAKCKIKQSEQKD